MHQLDSYLKEKHITTEPRHEKTCLRKSPTRQDTNWPAGLQKPARIYKFRIYKLEVSCCLDNKGADQTARIRRLICAFVVRIRHKQVFSWRVSIILVSRQLTKYSKLVLFFLKRAEKVFVSYFRKIQVFVFEFEFNKKKIGIYCHWRVVSKCLKDNFIFWAHLPRCTTESFLIL